MGDIFALIIIIILSFIYATALTTADKTARYGIYQLEGQTVEVMPGEHFMNEYLIVKPCVGKCSDKFNGMKPPIFDPTVVLANVRKLYVEDVIWPPLPLGNDLRKVELINVTPRGRFGACAQLEDLQIVSGDLSMTSTDWLSNCTSMDYLRLSGLNVTQIYIAIRSAVQIKYLYIMNLQNIEEWALLQNPIFSNRSSLMVVTIQSASNLEHKTTTWGDVSAGILNQISLLPRLQELEITLYGFNMCAGGFSPVTLASLRSLKLYNDNTTSVCFGHYRRLPLLERVTFGCTLLMGQACHNKDIEFKVVDVFSRPGHNLNVTAFNRRINYIFQLSRVDYLMLTSEPKKKMAYFDSFFAITVDCDCSDMFWLARAIKMGYITASAMTCRNGIPFEEFSCDRMECERVQCNSKCLCCRIGANGEFILDCRGLQLTQLPTDLLSLPNLTEVYAPNNRISSLPKTISERVHIMDVTGNQIRNMNGALLAEKSRHWRLAGNPLNCACDNKLLKDMLEHRKHQVEDLENAKCLNETLEISLQTLPDVCRSLELNISLSKEKERNNLEAKLAKDRENFLVISVATVTVMAVAASILGLAFYYRRPIQILLFARGWCLCWLKEEDLDEDRRYDVFLSFCHEDAELVLGHLLSTLDQEYSVCVHFRDWMPGEIIPTQIRNSVDNSRRTLIFLTKNFAKSLWGLLEFQTAYARGLEERRIRVVMVVVDDVLESPDLNKDLREYVRFTTYVRWGDPWFWSKLRYALPHKSIPFQPPQQHPAIPALADASASGFGSEM